MFTKTKNNNFENDAICTISCMVMPAVLPLCAVFYEEGCSFIDEKYNKKLLSTVTTGNNSVRAAEFTEHHASSL